MSITSRCGPHCGIRANAEDTVRREAHCDCGDPCHPGGLGDGFRAARLISGNRPDIPAGLPRGVPMCEQRLPS